MARKRAFLPLSGKNESEAMVDYGKVANQQIIKAIIEVKYKVVVD